MSTINSGINSGANGNRGEQTPDVTDNRDAVHAPVGEIENSDI